MTTSTLAPTEFPFASLTPDAGAGADPVIVEIVQGSLASVEMEVETAIARTSRSPMIRDAHDFRAGIHDRLMRKLNALIAVLEVANAKVSRSLDGPEPDMERLLKIRTNLSSTLEVCKRARRAQQVVGEGPKLLVFCNDRDVFRLGSHTTDRCLDGDGGRDGNGLCHGGRGQVQHRDQQWHGEEGGAEVALPLEPRENHPRDDQPEDGNRERDGQDGQHGARPQHRGGIAPIDEAADEESGEQWDKGVHGRHQAEDEPRSAEFEGAVGDEDADAVVGGVREHGMDDEAGKPRPVGWSRRAHPSASAVAGDVSPQGVEHRGGDEACDVPAASVDFLDE